jgi:outer membrane lipoprotein SlyB
MAEKGMIMRTCLYLAAFSLALAGMAEPAAAKGCLRGAFMGGVAGHYVAHHGVLGAAAGCIIGRHQANKRERERAVDDGGYDRSYNRYDRGQPIGTTYR